MKLLVLCVMAMLLFAGCAQQQAAAPVNENGDGMMKEKNGEKMPSKGETMIKASPEFTITSPKDGETVAAGDVSVTMSVRNFNIGEVGAAPKANEGHFHLFLDDGTYIPCASTTCIVKGVGAGEHAIRATIQNNDHSNYAGTSPRSIKIKATAPAGFDIIAPENGGVANAPKVIVKLATINFRMGTPGTANVPNEGHFHLFLDGGNYIVCNSENCEINGVSPGTHKLMVEMHNNDHSPYEGGEKKESTFVAKVVQPG